MSLQATVPTSKGWGLSASTLKIIACVLMVIDHIGAILLPQYMNLRIIGRLSYPIFAYLLAEGCRYTRSKLKRFLLVFGLAVVCEATVWIVMGEPEGGILVNFCLAILLIYQVQAFKKALAQGKNLVASLFFLLFGLSVVAVYGFIKHVFYVDYGFWGVLVPVWTVLPDYKEGEAPAWMAKISNRWVKFACFSVGLFLLCLFRGLTNIQSYCLLALPLIALYNGRPGRKGLKYGFYIFYPAHLALLWGISYLIS